jgi:hypothetical protein
MRPASFLAHEAGSCLPYPIQQNFLSSEWFSLRSFNTADQRRWKDRSQKAAALCGRAQRKEAPQPFVAVLVRCSAFWPRFRISSGLPRHWDGVPLSAMRGVASGPRPPRWAPHSNPKVRMPCPNVADSSFNLEIQYVLAFLSPVLRQRWIRLRQDKDAAGVIPCGVR